MGWKIWGLIHGKAKGFFSSAKRPDRIWGPPSILFQWVLRIISPGLKLLEHEVDYHLHLVLRKE
jgi:hypothetical protein